MVEGKGAPRCEVQVKRKVERGLLKLPRFVQEAMDTLVSDLEEIGPLVKHWPNFGALKGQKDKYHCHLSHHYIACWKWEKGSAAIEVYYAGSREDAPY